MIVIYMHINKGHDSLVLFEVNEDGTLTYIDFEDTSYDPVDMLVYNEEGNEWIVVACQKGGIVESYRLVKKKVDRFMKQNIAVWSMNLFA